MKGMEGCGLEGGGVGELPSEVRVVSVPAGAIACVNTALFFHI